jgi:thioredoxin reductase (NADPH)
MGPAQTVTKKVSEGFMAYAPTLTQTQIDRIRPYAKERDVTAGEVLYEPAFATPPVYVVLSGAIRIVAIGGDEERIVTTSVPVNSPANSS